MYIKLSGENIIGHTYENISDGAGYQLQIPTQVLVNDNGYYKFKIVSGALVILTQHEIDAHPNKVHDEILLKIDEITLLMKDKLALEEQKKDSEIKAEAKAIINEKISEIIIKINEKKPK